MSALREPSVREGLTGFVNIDDAMTKARARYAANPNLLPKLPPLYHNPLQEQEDADFDERYGIALAKCKARIAEGRKQLAAPCVAPAELTEEELAEYAREAKWDEVYRLANEFTDRQMADNDKLFEEVMALIDEVDSLGFIPDDIEVPEPPPTPRLEDIRDVPPEVVEWVRESRMRWRESLFREAASKPVIVMKPVYGELEYDYQAASRVASRMDKKKASTIKKAGSEIVHLHQTPYTHNGIQEVGQLSTKVSVDLLDTGRRKANTQMCSNDKATTTWRVLADWDFDLTW